MKPIEVTVKASRGVSRLDYIVQQGVPVKGMSPDQARKLGVFDQSGAPVPAGIEIDGTHPNGEVTWLNVSLPVTMENGQEQRFSIKESDGKAVGSALDLTQDQDGIKVTGNRFTAVFGPSGKLTVTNPRGDLIDGKIDFSIKGDVRSKYGRLIPVQYEPGEFEVVSATAKRVHIVNKGFYRPLEPKDTYLTKREHFGYDVDIEFVIYADSPAIRYRWTITNHMRFNCRYMWLCQYAVKFPLPEGSKAVAGEGSPEGDKFGGWAQVQTPAGQLGLAFPQWDWFGRGAGIEVKDGWALQGGINPPVDGGFGNTSPDIWRMFYYGMSRTFEGAVVVEGSEEQAKAEAYPIPLILPAQYYSDCGTLPEDGDPVTWGKWMDVVARGAENLLRSQWKGTLWCGEWWREWDSVTNQGTQETHSGNSSLGVLYHFYRTGDWRFWESAKMSYYYAYDIQFCKQQDGPGPYMHTRRFMLDHQEWFHPRYQRVGTLFKVGHLLADRVARDKVLWYLKFWKDNYIAEDGAPMTPNSDGSKSKCNESAMSNFAESLCYAYLETGDEDLLAKAKMLGDWVIRGIDTDATGMFIHNNNDTRYVQRGMIALCQVTKEQRYIDAFCRIAEWTAARQNDCVPNHLWFLSQGYKWSKSPSILDGIKRWVEDMLPRESKEDPGAFLYPQDGQIPPYPDCIWDDFYGKKAVVSYLPLVAGVLANAECGVRNAE